MQFNFVCACKKKKKVDFIMPILWNITPFIVLIFLFFLLREFVIKSSVYEQLSSECEKYILCSLTSVSLAL